MEHVELANGFVTAARSCEGTTLVLSSLHHSRGLSALHHDEGASLHAGAASLYEVGQPTLNRGARQLP